VICQEVPLSWLVHTADKTVFVSSRHSFQFATNRPSLLTPPTRTRQDSFVSSASAVWTVSEPSHINCACVQTHKMTRWDQRPVLEYCSHVFGAIISLTQIETIQKRAIRITYECTRDMPYRSALFCAGLSSLHSRRTDQAHGFFQSIMQPDSCIHALLPPPRDPHLLSRLRNPRM